MLKYFLVFLMILILGIGANLRLSFAQATITTSSQNFRNQNHTNLLGQCAATRIDCSPLTVNPGGGSISGPQSLIRVDSVVPGEIRCVSGFGTADGDSPGQTGLGSNNLCMTTGGVLWAGDERNMDAGDCGNTRFCNNFYPFTGFPRIPVGADTQFGVGAKASNGMDIGGTANDNAVPVGASPGNHNFTVRQDFKDTLVGGGGFGGGGEAGNFESNGQSSYKVNWSAQAPPDCISCPPTLIGNHFRSEPILDGGGNLIGRRHIMEYGHTQRWSNGITSNEGNTGTDRGDGDNMQQFIISFQVESTTDLNGNLTANPTGSYFSEIRDLGSTGDVDTTASGTVRSSESGTFNTAVTFPSGVPTASVTLTQSGGQGGCQHDSNGTSCINRSNTFLP